MTYKIACAFISQFSSGDEKPSAPLPLQCQLLTADYVPKLSGSKHLARRQFVFYEYSSKEPLSSKSRILDE